MVTNIDQVQELDAYRTLFDDNTDPGDMGDKLKQIQTTTNNNIVSLEDFLTNDNFKNIDVENNLVLLQNLTQNKQNVIDNNSENLYYDKVGKLLSLSLDNMINGKYVYNILSQITNVDDRTSFMDQYNSIFGIDMTGSLYDVSDPNNQELNQKYNSILLGYVDISSQDLDPDQSKALFGKIVTNAVKDAHGSNKPTYRQKVQDIYFYCKENNISLDDEIMAIQDSDIKAGVDMLKNIGEMDSFNKELFSIIQNTKSQNFPLSTYNYNTQTGNRSTKSNLELASAYEEIVDILNLSLNDHPFFEELNKLSSFVQSIEFKLIGKDLEKAIYEGQFKADLNSISAYKSKFYNYYKNSFDTQMKEIAYMSAYDNLMNILGLDNFQIEEVIDYNKPFVISYEGDEIYIQEIDTDFRLDRTTVNDVERVDIATEDLSIEFVDNVAYVCVKKGNKIQKYPAIVSQGGILDMYDQNSDGSYTLKPEYKGLYNNPVDYFAAIKNTTDAANSIINTVDRAVDLGLKLSGVGVILDNIQQTADWLANFGNNMKSNEHQRQLVMVQSLMTSIDTNLFVDPVVGKGGDGGDDPTPLNTEPVVTSDYNLVEQWLVANGDNLETIGFTINGTTLTYNGTEIDLSETEYVNGVNLLKIQLNAIETNLSSVLNNTQSSLDLGSSDKG